MIHTSRTVTVGKMESVINEPIMLYRGDREVEIEFNIVGSKFMFSNGGNVIKSTNATNGQLVINTPTGENMFSEVTECNDGKVICVITKEMIDELAEVGFYSFQIRLFDESQVSRVTIPPVYQGIEIRNPIAAEDETDLVDIGLVDFSVVRKDNYENVVTFLPNGDYNKTLWEEHDVISKDRLNKVEDALYEINKGTEGLYPTFQNQYDEFSAKVDKDVKAYKEEMEDEVEQFERDMAESVEKFKIDMAAVGTTQIREDMEVIDNKIPHVNIKSFGAKGDGITDDTEAIRKAIATGCNVLIPEGKFLITDTISLNTSLELFGMNRTKSILMIPYDFGEDKPVLQIDSQMVYMHNFTIRGNIGNTTPTRMDIKYPTSCGIAIHIPSTTNRQWSIIEKLFISGMDTGISYNNTYYHNVIMSEIHDCNMAIKFTNKPVGSVNIYDSHIRNNRLCAIYSDGANNVNINNCIFEWNKYHIRTTDSTGGGISFIGCYLGDGPYKALYMEGGTVHIDSCYSNPIGGSGGRMTETYPNGMYPDQDVKDPKNEYITCNIDVKGGNLYLKNTVLGRGTWGNTGFTYGGYDNGNSIEITGNSKVVFEDVLFSEGGVLHPESNSNSLIFSNKIDNYIINGTFSAPNQINNTIKGLTSTNLFYTINSSPYGGNMINISSMATKYIEFNYKIPEKLLNKVLLMGMIVGKGSNIMNTSLSPNNNTYSYVNDSSYDKYHFPSKNIKDNYIMMPFSQFDSMTEWRYAPVVCNNTEGSMVLKIQQINSDKPAIMNIHSVFLIEEQNFKKIGQFNDVYCEL